MKLFFRLTTFLVFEAVFGEMLWCALAFISAATVYFAAVAVEVTQLRLPERSFDADDIEGAMAGALTGVFVAWLGGIFLPIS